VPTLVAVAAVACGGGEPARRGESPVEAELRGALAKAISARVERVTCPTTRREPGPMRCIARAEGVEIPVAVRDDGPDLAWEVSGMVLSAPTLEREVGVLLDELAVAAKVDCGPRVRLIDAGGRVECTVVGVVRDGVPIAETGRAFATIDTAGGATLELVLGAAAVSARTEDVAEAELEALSRALDREPGGGDGEAYDAAPGDAYAPAPAPAP
jgi:hypothetical protein